MKVEPVDKIRVSFEKGDLYGITRNEIFVEYKGRVYMAPMEAMERLAYGESAVFVDCCAPEDFPATTRLAVQNLESRAS